MHSFLSLVTRRNPPFPAQGHTHFCHCFRLKSGRGSKAAKRLGEFLHTEWGLRLCQSRGVRVHHPLFLQPAKSFPEGLFVTMPVLGHPSFEESYPSVANWSSTWGQAGWSKGGRGGAPARQINFVFLMAYGAKVSLLSLSHEGLQFLKPGRAVPNILLFPKISIWENGEEFGR